jgi:hypothetical protein
MAEDTFAANLTSKGYIFIREKEQQEQAAL